MTLFAVQFKDKSNSYALRQIYLDAHIAWLDEHKDQILVGGSLRLSLDQAPIGGLWIVESESREAIEMLMKTDPFWIHGLRESVDIYHWSKAIEDRKVLV